jgi:hypothetical protein
MQPIDEGYRALIPVSLRTTHEQQFSAVLDHFLAHTDKRARPPSPSTEVLAKYTLLAKAKALSAHSGV